MKFIEKFGSYVTAVARQLKDDFDQGVAAASPFMPQQIHGDSFNDGPDRSLEVLAFCDRDNDYKVVPYEGTRKWGLLWVMKRQEPLAQAVTLEVALSLMNDWCKANKERGYAVFEGAQCGSGAHYRLVARNHEVHLR